MDAPSPTQIELHQRSRVFEIHFDDGAQFELPCEYLRVNSPAAENRADQGQGKVITGKEEVNIREVVPVGNYAVKLVFDDGHDSAVYSWGTLYKLGQEYASRWPAYLDSLRAMGYVRKDGIVETGGLAYYPVKVLYFVSLVQRLSRQEEVVQLPPSVNDVRKLLAYLRKRGAVWEALLQETALQITVNRQFASPDTRLQADDEVGLVPKAAPKE